MENVLSYRTIILDVLKEIIGFERRTTRERFTRLVADHESDVYLYLHYGWKEARHIHAVYVHIDIIDGKIWVQRNYTEHDVPEMLLAAGVPPDKIVLGGVAPYMREATPFAQG